MKQLLIMMLALTFGATSCQKSAIERDPNGPDNQGEQVRVTLNLSTAPTETATTKSAGRQVFTSEAMDMTIGEAGTKSTTELTEAQDRKINNLWILQFTKSTGARNGTPIYLSSTAFQQDGVEVGVPVKLTAASAAQVIYVVANTGSSSLFSGSNAPATESALQAKALSVGTEYKPSTSAGIPMLGRIEVASVTSTAGTTVLSGTLERMFAKIKFKLTNSFPDYTVSNVQLKNVSANAYYREAQTGSVSFPASATSSHKDYPSEAYKTTEYVWYVPENLRVGATTNNIMQRTLDKSNSSKGTYVEVSGTHSTNATVTYQFLLGDIAKALNDYNVRRNHTYAVDVTVKGVSATDQRITVSLGTMAAPANSFMVAPGGTVKFDTRIRGNGSSNDAGTGLATPIAPASVALVWQDAAGLITNANSSTGVVPFLEGMATVTAKSGSNGNALVAAYDGANGTGNILWSWHIWVTDYVPVGRGSVAANTAYTVTGGQVHTYGSRYLTTNPGKVIMDRNLGATQSGTITTGTTSAADAPKAFGQMYQWGRKDPLGQGQTAGSSTLAPWYNAAGTAVTSANTAGPVTLAVAYQNPTKFYYNGGGNYDWLSTQNGNLWQDNVKTIFDPCPAGWRVPKGWTSNEVGTWNDFTSTGGTVVNSGDEVYTGTIFPYFINGTQQTANGTPTNTANVRNGRLYQVGSVKAWYPAVGYRYFNSGNLGSVGSYGSSWASTASEGMQGRCLQFNYSSISPTNSNYRAYGRSVRCIQE